MIKELYLAKDFNGEIYGFQSYPVWEENDGDGYWLLSGDEPIIYQDSLLFLFGDKIKSIEVTENLPVKIMFNAEVE